MMRMLEGAGRLWESAEMSPPRITVNDISWGNNISEQFGGPFPPHSSHQNGLDVDIRYVRTDDAEAPLNVADDPESHDQFATSHLISYLNQRGKLVKVIVSSKVMLDNPDPFSSALVIDDDGEHDDHFHVRIADPDGTDN